MISAIMGELKHIKNINTAIAGNNGYLLSVEGTLIQDIVAEDAPWAAAEIGTVRQLACILATLFDEGAKQTDL